MEIDSFPQSMLPLLPTHYSDTHMGDDASRPTRSDSTVLTCCNNGLWYLSWQHCTVWTSGRTGQHRNARHKYCSNWKQCTQAFAWHSSRKTHSIQSIPPWHCNSTYHQCTMLELTNINLGERVRKHNYGHHVNFNIGLPFDDVYWIGCWQHFMPAGFW